jgi:hypothetical protein
VYVFTYAGYSQKIKLLSGLHVHIRVAPVALARPYARNIFFSLQFALSLQPFTARNQPGSTTGSPTSPTPRQTPKNNPPATPEDIPPRQIYDDARARPRWPICHACYFKPITGDQKAQQSPNNNPAEISRQYNPQAIYPTPSQKKAPGTIDRGS